MDAKREMKSLAKNRKASYLYEIITTYKAGIVLSGTEVKSCRRGKANLTDAHCTFKNGELWVYNLHISEYKNGGMYNHKPTRERKLLLKKRELKKLEAKVKERGFTIIATEVFLSERNFVKLKIALAKGKKLFNKKESIKAKDNRREMERMRKTGW